MQAERVILIFRLYGNITHALQTTIPSLIMYWKADLNWEYIKVKIFNVSYI